MHDRKTEHFKALTSNSHSSAIADHMTQTGHRIKWDHFDILATGQSDMLAVRNVFSTSHLYFSQQTWSVYFHLLFHCHYFSYLV